jgi:hypothetical protein
MADTYESVVFCWRGHRAWPTYRYVNIGGVERPECDPPCTDRKEG